MYDRFYEQILDEHEERRRRAGAGEFVASDLVDVLLQLAEKGRSETSVSARTLSGGRMELRRTLTTLR